MPKNLAIGDSLPKLVGLEAETVKNERIYLVNKPALNNKHFLVKTFHQIKITQALESLCENEENFLIALQAAVEYINDGLSINSISPQVLENDDLLPRTFGYQVGSSQGWTNVDVWIGPLPIPEEVGVGIGGPESLIKPILDRFYRYARAAYFPYPSPVTGTSKLSNVSGELVLSFDSRGLNLYFDKLSALLKS